MATKTFNPTAHGNAVRRTNGTWSSIRNGDGTGANNFPDAYAVSVGTSSTTNEFSRISRGVLVFDTSSLSDNLTINSATLQVYNDGKNNFLNLSDEDAGIGLVSASPSSNDSLTASDYQTLGETEYANRIPYSDLSAGSDSGYRTFTLSETGINYISTTDHTAFGIRLGADLDDNEPSWLDSEDTTIVIDTKESPFSDGIAILTIDYTSERTPKQFRVTGETKRIYG